MKVIGNLVVTVLVSTSLYAWNPTTCSADEFANRGRFEAQMRAARPGDPIYVAKPFPRTDAEVIEDFNQQVQILLSSGTHPLIEGGQSALRRAIEKGTLHIGIVHESNWRNFRCLMYRSGEAVYLLRLFDTSTSTEIGRATIEESGLLNGIIYPLDRRAPIWARALPTLAEGERVLNLTVGKVVDIQYATSYGTVGCDDFMPCIAGRTTGGGYAFMSYNGVYTFNAGSRRIDQRPTVRDKTELERTLQSLGRNEGLTTIGSDYDVIATKVADRP